MVTSAASKASSSRTSSEEGKRSAWRPSRVSPLDGSTQRSFSSGPTVAMARTMSGRGGRSKSEPWEPVLITPASDCPLEEPAVPSASLRSSSACISASISMPASTYACCLARAPSESAR